jgi:tRNA(adenine34) deaminase
MWADLPAQRQACLELAWESYRKGSIPIAAVICDRDEIIVSSGRNRSQGAPAPSGNQIVGGSLAHAEINALLGLSGADVNVYELEFSL